MNDARQEDRAGGFWRIFAGVAAMQLAALLLLWLLQALYHV